MCQIITGYIVSLNRNQFQKTDSPHLNLLKALTSLDEQYEFNLGEKANVNCENSH